MIDKREKVMLYFLSKCYTCTFMGSLRDITLIHMHVHLIICNSFFL